MCEHTPRSKGKVNLFNLEWLISMTLRWQCYVLQISDVALCLRIEKHFSFWLLPSLWFCLRLAHTLSPSLHRPILLPDPPHQAHLRWGGASLSQWWCSDCQSGPDICCLEASGLWPLWRRLAGGWQCPLPYFSAKKALQSYRGCSAFCGVPG